MSAPPTGEMEAGSKPKEQASSAGSLRTYNRDCVLFFGDSAGPIIASGKVFGDPAKIRSQFVAFRAADVSTWLGLKLHFSFGDQKDNENSGFGVCYFYNRSTSRVELVEQYSITVKFPRGQCDYVFEDPEPETLSRFPDLQGRSCSLVTVRLKEGARVKVDGYGLPFANSSDSEVESWVNVNAPVVKDVTLLDVLQQGTFYFLVDTPVSDMPKRFSEDRLPPPFSYPWGTKHDWKEDRYKSMLVETKSKTQFRPAYRFDDDNSHVAVVTQAIVQDVWWINEAAEEISTIKLHGYFIPFDAVKEVDDANRFFFVIPVSKEFRDRYRSAWGRLTKSETFHLLPFDGLGDHRWKCEIVSHPETRELLKDHPTAQHEIVLFAWRIQKPGQARFKSCVSLDFDSDIRDAQRKVNAMQSMLPNAEARPRTHGDTDVMDLHRAVMRGNGVFDWMTRTSLVEQTEALSLQDSPKSELKTLPVVNFFDVDDATRADALLEEALPQDRPRFRAYMSNRPLGLGISTAGPGFGKTTGLAVAALLMQAKVGKVLCSAPSNVAIDNFAERLDRITSSATARANKDNEASTIRRSMVLRGYKADDELAALSNLLKNPSAGDGAAPYNGLPGGSKWKLHLSVAFWLLVLLRSPAVRPLHADDGKALHDIQRRIDSRPDLGTLRAVATGKITWADYLKGTQITKDKVVALCKEVIRTADLLCLTPALTDSGEYGIWKGNANGAAVDEAANMNRADLVAVWGNTLLPCFLGGDTKQLPPTVMTSQEKDASDNFLHRLPRDGKISPLEFLQASGMPVYRYRVQLRMAEGLFDDIAAEVYPDLTVQYGTKCQVSLPQFAAGRELEAYIQEKYPGVKTPPPGKLSPVFIHCEKSRVHIDNMAGSKRCPFQATLALDLALDLVSTKEIKPAQIVILAPYTANVELITGLRKRPKYAALLPMPPTSTVDGFQGQENDIVIVVMGTAAFPGPGPGFTSDEQRLNVMLTRQRAGLVIVGDIHVTGKIGQDGKIKAKGKGIPKDKVASTGANNEVSWNGVKVLQNLYLRFWKAGRVTIGITEAKDANIINGCLMIFNWLTSVASAFASGCLKRRTQFLISGFGMLLVFSSQTLCAGLFNERGNQAAGHGVLAMLFLFYVFFNFAFNALLYSYPVEILPYPIRAKGFSVLMFFGKGAGFVNAFVNPVGLQALAWKYFGVYVGWLCIEVACIYFFFPETSGRSLEAIASVFDGDLMVDSEKLVGNREGPKELEKDV